MRFSLSFGPGGRRRGPVAWITQWLVSAVSLALVVRFVNGVTLRASDPLRGALSVLGAAALLGLLNVLVKPVLLLVTLPVNVLSLGLFTLVVNGAVLWMAAALTPDLRLAGFGTAVWAAFCLSVCSLVLGALFGGVRVEAGRGGS